MNKLRSILSIALLGVLAFAAAGCSVEVPSDINAKHDVIHVIPDVNVNHTVTINLPADLLIAIEDQCAEAVDPEVCRNELIIDFINTLSQLYENYSNGQQ